MTVKVTTEKSKGPQRLGLESLVPFHAYCDDEGDVSIFLGILNGEYLFYYPMSDEGPDLVTFTTDAITFLPATIRMKIEN